MTLLDVKALAAQVFVFMLGLALSLVAGMLLAAVLDGPGGLLIATVVAGAGLLGAAVLSQVVHDHLFARDAD